MFKQQRTCAEAQASDSTTSATRQHMPIKKRTSPDALASSAVPTARGERRHPGMKRPSPG